MPFSSSYADIYLGTYNASTHQFTTTLDFGFSEDLADTADGTDDGSVAVSDSIFMPTESTTFAFVGTTANNGAILFNGSSYYLVSNTTGLANGTTVAVDTTSAYTFCFLAGTRIATAGGERPVESLAIGDLVATHDGRQVPVRWIGRQTRPALLARLTGDLPVRIRAGALGEAVPASDLLVSPDHALLVDGLLIHAGVLVNGTSITRLAAGELAEIAYYHVETAAHEVILANGAPAETFIDNVSREKFDNHAEFLALYPHAPAMTELPFGRVKLHRQLPARIAERLARIADTLPVGDAAQVA